MLSLTTIFGDDAAILREKNFQALLLASTLPVLGMSLLSPMLELLIGPLGTSPARISLMVSMYAAPAIVLIPIAGLLADRYSRKRVLTSAITLFGLAGTAIVFTTDYRVVLALRFLQGIGFAGITPIVITCIGDLYEGETEVTGQGIRFMTSGLSGSITPVFASLLVIYAWQYPFLLYAVSIPIAVYVHLRFEEPSRTDSSSPVDGTEDGSYVNELFRLSSRRRVLALVLARWLWPAVWIAFITYNSIIVIRLKGGTPVQAGVLTSIGFFVFAVAASQAGRLTTQLKSRLHPLILANVSMSAGFGLFLFSSGMIAASVGVVALGFGFGITGTLYRSIITGLAPTDLRAGLVSLSEGGGRLVSTLTPLAMGVMIALASPTMGFAPALQLTGIVVALVGGGCSILCLVVARSSSLAPAERSSLGNNAFW